MLKINCLNTGLFVDTQRNIFKELYQNKLVFNVHKDRTVQLNADSNVRKIP